MKNPDLAALELDQWLERVKDCGIPEFIKLGEKIARHRKNILNAVELQVNSSKSEAANTTIKSMISVARGFRNLNNLFALVYLRCSAIIVPLNTAITRETAGVKRDRESAQESQRRS